MIRIRGQARSVRTAQRASRMTWLAVDPKKREIVIERDDFDDVPRSNFLPPLAQSFVEMGRRMPARRPVIRSI